MKLNDKSKNIFIGENAGINITTETNMLCLKSKTIDFENKITDREHGLIALALSCYIENKLDFYKEMTK